MAMRAVDLDLFVNSASKGFNDGAKVPSPFAAFTNAFIQGIDAQQDYETQALQNEQRRIAIEQAPIEARVKEAQAVKAEAEAAVITENPDLYKEAQLAGLKAQAAEKERLAIQNRKKTEFLEILNSGDGAAQGDALLSGKFDDIMDPKQKEQYIKSTFKDWTDDQAKLYKRTVQIEQQKEWETKALQLAATKQPELMEALEANGDIERIREAVGSTTSVSDLLAKGSIITIKAAPDVPLVKKDASGKPLIDPNTGLEVPELDEFGYQRYGQDPTGSFTDKTVERRVFVYDGKPYDIGTSLSTDTYNTFNRAKSNYGTLGRLRSNQDGVGDLENSRQQKKDIEAKQNADAAMAYQKNASEIKTQQDAFLSGARINPQYQAAAKRVEGQLEENRALREPARKEPPITYPEDVPDLTPSADPSVNTPPPGPAPSFNIRPGTAAAVKATPQPGPSPATYSQAQQETQLKKQMARSKAQQIVSKYQKTNAPVPPSPTPVDQAREVTASSFIPSNFKVNIPTKFGPQPEAINKVASDPLVQNFSAITKAMIAQESSGRIDAVSGTGVKGIAQLSTAAASDISKDLDRTDPVQNAIGGAIYLEKLMANPTYENNPMLALTAYNGGPAVAAKAVQLAGSTDWSKVRNFLEAAVLDPAFTSYWKRLKIDPKQKAREVREYAERVVANFGPFVSTRSDMNLAEKLKQQNVLVF